MADFKNGAEGGVDGVAVTSGSGGNSGGASGRYFDTVSIAGSSTITFDNDHPASGSLGYKFTTNGTDAQYLAWLPAASNMVAFREYLYLPSLPSAGNGHIRFLTAGGGTTLAHVVITNANIQVQNMPGTTIFTSSAAIPTAQIVRVEGSISNGNTATGTFNLDFYLGDSPTPISGLSASLTGQNFGTTQIGQVRFGRTAGFGTWASFWIDGLAVRDGSTTYFGPDVNTPPTVNAGANQSVAASSTVNLSATASDTDGSIVSYAWAFTYPTSGAPSLTGGTTATPSFTAGSAGNLYVLNCTVTDSGGASAIDSVEVRVPVAADVEIRPLEMDGTSGIWQIGGGSDTEGEALADEDNATYVESPPLTGTGIPNRWRMQPSVPKPGAGIPVRLASTAGTSDWTFRLFEGSTLRQTFNIVGVGTTPNNYELDVSATVTDWGSVYVEAEVTVSD